jgi:hypothetical protein
VPKSILLGAAEENDGGSGASERVLEGQVYLLPPGWVIARHDLVECVKSLQVDKPAVAPDAAAARNLATLRLRVQVVAPEHVAVVSLVANRAASVSTACDYLQAKEVEEVVAQDLASPQGLAQSYRPRNYLLSW